VDAAICGADSKYRRSPRSRPDTTEINYQLLERGLNAGCFSFEGIYRNWMPQSVERTRSAGEDNAVIQSRQNKVERSLLLRELGSGRADKFLPW
jgi:hypothetical protein